MSSEITEADYRVRVRSWLADNLERKAPGTTLTPRGSEHHTRESLKPQRALQRTLFEGGYAGITWPPEYGGQGLTPAHQRVFDDEASDYVLPDLGVAGITTFGVCAPTMLAHASPEFLVRYGPRMLSGDMLVCQFFSEPGAGSDLAGVTTRAQRDGDHWVLNGAKVWTSGAYYADYGMCLTRTDWDAPKHRGLTWFLVPTDAPGVDLQPIREINGDDEFCEEFFTDVHVPDTERIGAVDDGWTVAQTMLVFERGAGRGVAASAPTGPGPLAPDLVALATRLGRTDDPLIRQQIARAHTNDYVHAQLGVRIKALIESGSQAGGVSGYGKLSSAQITEQRARIGMEIGGGAALVWPEGDLERQRTSLAYLNGRLRAIAGGTSEMQRNGIGERVLGLPREPSFDKDKPFREVLRNAGNWSGQR